LRSTRMIVAPGEGWSVHGGPALNEERPTIWWKSSEGFANFHGSASSRRCPEPGGSSCLPGCRPQRKAGYECVPVLPSRRERV